VARTLRAAARGRPVNEAQLAALELVDDDVLKNAAIDLLYEQQGLDVLRREEKYDGTFRFGFDSLGNIHNASVL
jgi:hypothetical protein